MHTIRGREVLLAAILSAMAGFIDAIGFIELGGHFVSFMSGNTTQMAAGGALRDWASMRMAGALIGIFFLGAVAGAVAARGGRSRVSALWLVCALLLIAAVIGSSRSGTAAMLVLAAGMGAMNAVFQRDGEVSIGLTYVTGTLVKTAHRLVDAFTGGDRTLWLRHLAQWAALAVGGFCGALTYHHLGLDVLWMAAGAMLLITICTAVVRKQYW